MDILSKLGINETFFVQLINFVILVFILYKILYKPLFKNINERNERIKKGLELTEKMEKEYLEVENKRIEAMKKAQEDATRIINIAESKAEDKSLKIIEETRNKGNEMLKDYEQILIKEREKLEKEFNLKVYESVKLVLKKVLNEDKSLDEKFVASVIKRNNE